MPRARPTDPADHGRGPESIPGRSATTVEARAEGKKKGEVTEQVDGVTFPQRRFTSDDERDYALRELEAMGIEAAGREAEGAYHVNVFLSRPVEDAAERSIDDILGDLTDGADHTPSA